MVRKGAKTVLAGQGTLTGGAEGGVSGFGESKAALAGLAVFAGAKP